jgi:hypothetical protein
LSAATAAMICVGVLALGAWSNAMHREGAALSLPSLTATNRKGIALFDGKFRVNPQEFPVIGNEASPDSRTVILLSDYTSELSRQYHASLAASLPAVKVPVRVVLLPAAQSPDAEDIQRMVLTLFHADPGAWRTLSALLTSGQISAKPEAVLRAARKLAGAEKWTAAVEAHQDKVDRQIGMTASLLKELRRDGESTGPVLICGGKSLAPVKPDMDQLIAFSGKDAAPASAPPAASPVVTDSAPVASASPPAPKKGKKNTQVIPAVKLPDLPPAPSGTPALSLSQKEWKLEPLLQGKSQEIQIEVRNSGNAPLNIKWLALDAGCEVAALPSPSIAPGEASKISLRVNAPDESGEFSRTIHIHSDAPGEPGTVTIRGELKTADPAPSPAPDPNLPTTKPTQEPNTNTPEKASAPESNPNVPEAIDTPESSS